MFFFTYSIWKKRIKKNLSIFSYLDKCSFWTVYKNEY
jgi:hypothetical protein